MNYKLLIVIVVSVLLLSCDTAETINDIIDSKITAKEKLAEVINSARSDFSADAKLAAIFGREISDQGEADISNTNSLSNFIYAVQSDALQANEFYIPVLGAGPVKSPVNLNDLLGLIKDPVSKNIMGVVFSKLAAIAISDDASYNDSPQVMTAMLNNNAVITFRSNNVNSKTDMFLVPSKSLDSTFASSADWIVNFYTSSNSLTMWLNSDTGEIKNLSEL